MTVLTLFAAAQGKKWKSCDRRIQRFERCLERGYKSKAGCVSGEGKLEGSRAWRRCRRLENKIDKKCDYVCEKEPVLIPEECRVKLARLIGTELRSLQPLTFEDCRVECSHDPDCEGFTFTDYSHFDYFDTMDEKNRLDHLKCALMTDVKGLFRHHKFNSMMKGCDRSEVDVSCLEESTELVLSKTHPLYATGAGNPYRMGSPDIESLQECAQFCRDFKDCKAITYAYLAGQDRHACSMFNAVPVAEDEAGLTKGTPSPYGANYSAMTMNCDAI